MVLTIQSSIKILDCLRGRSTLLNLCLIFIYDLFYRDRSETNHGVIQIMQSVFLVFSTLRQHI